MDDISKNTAISLQQIINEERNKRLEAEKYAKSLAEEFANCNDFDEARAAFKNALKEFAPQAVINIVTLAQHAESESVRAALNKYIIDWVMSDKVDASAGELNELLKALQKAEK